MREEREQGVKTRTAVAQEVAQSSDRPKWPEDRKRQIPSGLTGRAGLSFVEFQLGRRGCEFVRTYDSSASGDIWAETGIGRVSIEVKTTDGSLSWFIKNEQSRADIVIFVNLQQGSCYILTAAEARVLFGRCVPTASGICKLQARWMRNGEREAWHKLNLQYARKLPVAADLPAESPHCGRYHPPRIEKMVRIDGAVKYWVRPARGIPRTTGKHVTFGDKVAEMHRKGLPTEWPAP